MNDHQPGALEVKKPGKLIVVIGGPTCSGKSTLAILLAQHFNTEIISADSRQFYKELNIGTAKPPPMELALVRHHFINSHHIASHVNANDFASASRKLVENLFENHDVVIMAGGSGLYIDAFLNGIDDLPPANEKIRTHLEALYNTSGMEALQELLKTTDPESYSNIDIHNRRRLTRALEVSMETGKPYSSQLGRKQAALPWNYIIAGIEWPREILYERINSRTKNMIADGLEDEVRELICFRQLKALQTVGYQEMFQYLDGQLTLEETDIKIAQNTRNYAKRQLTWFRKYEDMIWIKPGDESELIGIIEKRIRII